MPNIQFQFRRGASSEWSFADPVLAPGEVGIETDTNLFKIGDGINYWNQLPYGGLQGTTGNQGIQGITGASITIIGTIPDVNEDSTDPQVVLDTAFPDAVKNNLVIDEATGDGWVYDGAVWTNVGPVRGPQGVTGSQGIQGVQGPQGHQGIQGSQGRQGIQGFVGEQGVQGITGSSIRIIGTIPDVYVDPPNDPQQTLEAAFPSRIINDIVIDLAGGDGWIFDGNVWSNVGPLRGPQGIQGIQGVQGRQGLQGIQGRQGIQGVQGEQGIQGITGSSIRIIGTIPDAFVNPPNDPQQTLNTAFPGRIINDIVVDLATGDGWIFNGTIWSNVGPVRGPQGIQGIQGTQSPQGIQGRQGIQGPQGVQGRQGVQGVQGITGSSISIIGSVPDVNVSGNPQQTLNTAFPLRVQNNIVIDTATGNGWLFDGTLWNNIGPLRGPQGIQGTAGSQGAQGIQGATGPSISINATDTTAAGTYYPVFVAAAGSNQTPRIRSTATAFSFNPGTGEVAAVDFNSLSDNTLKKDVVGIDDSLEIITQLNPVSFNWKDFDKKSFGFIAQEVEKILPEIVTETQGKKALSYLQLIPFLVSAIKKLDSHTQNLERTLNQILKTNNLNRDNIDKSSKDLDI